MAYVAPKIAYWDIVQDAVTYRIRLVTPGSAIDYTQAADLEVAADSSKPQQEEDLATIGKPDGTYDVLITAVDSGGNESDPLDLAGAVLDFTPPAAPASGGFR